jgi:hypothetical protein
MKLVLIGASAFLLATLYFYGLDQWLMSAQGLSVGSNLMPR